jgi:hypothetical protein
MEKAKDEDEDEEENRSGCDEDPVQQMIDA